MQFTSISLLHVCQDAVGVLRARAGAMPCAEGREDGDVNSARRVLAFRNLVADWNILVTSTLNPLVQQCQPSPMGHVSATTNML